MRASRDPQRRTEVVLTALIAALAVPVHLLGLFVPSLYRDPAILLPQNLGTDLVTVALMIPLLVGAAWAMPHSSRARVLWLGALGYCAYAYGMYALGVHWNRLFLAYVALFGVSAYALLLGLARTDVVAIRDDLAPRAPVRATAAYLVAVAVLVGGIWLAEEIGATVTGVVPPSLGEFEAPTNIVHVFDLGLVLPALVIASILLLRGRVWGYVLSGMLLVKCAAIGLWILAMIGFSTRAGFPGPFAYTVFFALLTIAGLLLTARFLGLLPARRAARVAPGHGIAR